MDYLNVQENNDLNVYLSELPTASEPIYKIKYLRLEHAQRESIVSFYSSKFAFIKPVLANVGKKVDKFVKNMNN